MAQKPALLTQFSELPTGKYLYFASDFHLGTPTYESSLEREKKIIRWLKEVRKDAAGIFLVGDIFDFWFEYKKVIPKGFSRFQACLSDLREKGIPIYFFTGNHDAWLFDYFPTEFGIPVFRKPIELIVGNQKLLVGHGDGLGPGDHFYKLLKRIFEGKLPQWLFRWIHPEIGVALAQRWSRSSRLTNTDKDMGFVSKENEWLWQYARSIEASDHYDYYLFGHRHIPLELPVTDDSTYLNLGEWVNHCTYVKYDGQSAQLLTYTS